MKFFPFALLLFLATLSIVTHQVGAHELSGYLAAEGRGFFHEPLFVDQHRNNGSVAFEPEYYHQLDNGSSITVTPFLRLDSEDSKRSHFDMRELNFLWLHDSWELNFGVSKVFWGATEFVHLVDIINQTDSVEHIDGEEKLGQPMVHLSIPRDWGIVDLFVLPWFRERTFAGAEGRLRHEVVVDTDNAEYESAAKEHHTDFALRYSHTIGDADFGLYHFIGTSREPTLVPVVNRANVPAFFIPFYEQINQTGFDLQLVAGQWLWKLEAAYRTGQDEEFFAGVGGCEYTFVRTFGSDMDLGLIAEWAYDERGSRATTSFENDIMFGLRLAVNDAASSELLAGYLQDYENSSRVFSVEASRRIGNNWKLTLETYFFSNQPRQDLLYNLRDDDYVSLALAYYF